MISISGYSLVLQDTWNLSCSMMLYLVSRYRSRALQHLDGDKTGSHWPLPLESTLVMLWSAEEQKVAP